jgi:hypothetical protein
MPFYFFLEKERFDNTPPSTQTSKFTGHRSAPSGDSGPILPPDWTVSHVTVQSSGRTRTGSILVMMDWTGLDWIVAVRRFPTAVLGGS